MAELFWIVRMGFCVWIAWKAVLMLGVTNPLMGIFFAIICMLGAPYALDALIDAFAGQGDPYGLWEALGSLRLVIPLASAVVGTFVWSGIETAFGR